MKKIFRNLLLLTIVTLCTVMMASCNKDEKEELSRVTIDINPSIELIVDDENKVVSVSALNDDGSIIISGEAIVGKTVEEATQIIINVCTETGYIVKSETTIDTNKVSVSVSGDSKYAKELAEDIMNAAKDCFEKNGIKATVEQVNALAIEELKELVLNNSTFTKEEVENMTETELLKALAVSRIETAELMGEELKKLYFEAKRYEISFAEKEATAKVIEELGGIYTIVVNSYSLALESYRSAITKLEETKYNTLISPNSAYQKALNAVREAKAEYLEQRSYVASLEIGDLKVNAEIELNNLKEKYEKLEAALVKTGEEATKGFDWVISNLKTAEEGFSIVEVQLKSLDFDQVLTSKVVEIEEAMNNAKNNFFEKFEELHKEDLLKYEADLKAKKEELKNLITNKNIA